MFQVLSRGQRTGILTQPHPQMRRMRSGAGDILGEASGKDGDLSTEAMLAGALLRFIVSDFLCPPGLALSRARARG